jgi:hypothetical protein
MNEENGLIKAATTAPAASRRFFRAPFLEKTMDPHALPKKDRQTALSLRGYHNSGSSG